MQAEKALQELREALEANDGYVLGTFSYADVTMAVAANAIEPLGPPISKCAPFLPAAIVHTDMTRLMSLVNRILVGCSPLHQCKARGRSPNAQKGRRRYSGCASGCMRCRRVLLTVRAV